MTTISKNGVPRQAAVEVLNVWIRAADWGTLCAWIQLAGSHAEAALKLEFHHINYISKDVDALHRFYVDILKMDDIAPQNFPRTDATDKTG
jgi:hypothetical protein